jgi:hypothetical protein
MTGISVANLSPVGVPKRRANCALRNSNGRVLRNEIALAFTGRHSLSDIRAPVLPF